MMGDLGGCAALWEFVSFSTKAQMLVVNTEVFNKIR